MSTALEVKKNTMVDQANAVNIINQKTYDLAADLLRGVKLLRQEAERHHRPVINAAHQAHKEAIAALKRIDDPLNTAERTIKGRIGAWDQEQERIRREAQRQAEEQARREQEEAALAAAVEAEDLGVSPEEVDEILEMQARAPMVAPPPPEPTYERAAGVSTRKRYEVRVTDARTLLNSVLAKQPALVQDHGRFIGVKLADLDRVAKMQGGRLDLDGLEVIESRDVAVRV